MVNGVLDDVHRPDVAYFTRKVILLAQENQGEILGVHQQLTNQLMTITMKGLMKTSV
jgi:hypothetical protein